ncbi:hypothetical protein LCGC14_2964340, partial [marine sediment metagenome]
NLSAERAIVVNSEVSYALKPSGNRDIINVVDNSFFTVGRTSGLTQMVAQHRSLTTSANDHQEFVAPGVVAQVAAGPSYIRANTLIEDTGGTRAEIEMVIVTNGVSSIITDISNVAIAQNTYRVMKLETRNGFQAFFLDGVLISETTLTANDSDTTLYTGGVFCNGGGFFQTNTALIDGFVIYSGNAVVVNNVPTDHYVQIGSEVSQEDGSVVTMTFFGGIAFPLSTITLSSFDTAEPTRLSTVTALIGDVWGGDTFALSLITVDDWEKPIIADRPNPWGLLSKTTEQDDIDFLLRVKSQYAHQLGPTPTAVTLHESVISL